MYLKPTFKIKGSGTSLVVQWLRLPTPNAAGMSLILGQGTKIPHAVWHGQKKKKKFKVDWQEKQ